MDKKIPGGTSNVRSEWPARYMANGPQGTFYTDDLKLADALLRAYDEDDDWTVTEMPDPTGTLAAQQPAAVGEAMVDRACDAYAQIADDCMGLVRRKAMRAALTVALGDAQRLVAKLAAHVRPTCSELWDEAQTFLAAEGAQAEECCVPDASESSFILPGCDPLVEKLLSIVIEDKEQERTTARAEQPAAICTCPHQDAREPYHDVACPARPAQQPATSTLVGAEDIEVLKRLRAALPDVGLNGWWLGVEVLNRVIDALDTKHKEPTT